MAATDDFYREQAQACGEAADLAELDNQREKFLAAQRAWRKPKPGPTRPRLRADAPIGGPRGRRAGVPSARPIA